MELRGWRFFQMMELREAFAWADDGGIAVHETGVPFGRFTDTAHLFAPDRVTLDAVATSLGCSVSWRQEKSLREHYDLFGRVLERAMARCNAPELSLGQ